MEFHFHITSTVMSHTEFTRPLIFYFRCPYSTFLHHLTVPTSTKCLHCKVCHLTRMQPICFLYQKHVTGANPQSGCIPFLYMNNANDDAYDDDDDA